MLTDKAQSLNRAIRILDCFTQEKPELGVREVARMVELSSSATGRLMLAMRDMGILTQNPHTRTYRLGARVLTWAGIYLTTSDVRNVALPSLQELHRLTNETISLYVLDGKERVCVERLESPHNVRIVARIGRRLPLYAGSAGKVLLAFLPDKRCEEIIGSTDLVPLTQKTIVDNEALHTELQQIRSQGYAVSKGEWLLDASGVAAPVFDQSGEVIAAVTISGPSQRFTDDVLPAYIQHTNRVARQISTQMGYRTIQPTQQQPTNPRSG